MWTTLEIIQFIVLNLIAAFFIYISAINWLIRTKKTIIKVLHMVIFFLNIIWFCAIYGLTFIFWKSSWGVVTGINYGSICLNVLYFFLTWSFDKQLLKELFLLKKN